MKLAILYVGLPDFFKETSETHRVLFDNFDVDTYISTWDNINMSTILRHIPSTNVISVTSNLDHIDKVVNQRMDNLCKHMNINKEATYRTMRQYYIIEQANNILNPLMQNYDLVMKLRFDVFFHKDKLNIEQLKDAINYKDVIFGWRDRFNYGCPASMNLGLQFFSKCTAFCIGDHMPNIEILWLMYLNFNGIRLVENFNEFTIKKPNSEDKDQRVVS